MILRLKYPEGQARLEIDPKDDVSILIKKICELIKKEPSDIRISTDQEGNKILSQGQVQNYNLKNGDFVHVQYSINVVVPPPEASIVPSRFIKQFPIDDILEKNPGLVIRPKSTFCKHGSVGMCDYCMPLEPYDSNYLTENKIKHMSFHAYLKQCITLNKTAPITSPQFIPPLNDYDFKPKSPCPSKSHGDYPVGICSKCQPSSATLQTQAFRMVDHIEFESASIVDNFIRFWRSTGYQRYGILYGKYEPYSEIPLGIKAVVSAIYEPPQQDETDSIQVETDPKFWQINQVAELCGMIPLGMIYTDLLDDGTGAGTVVCKRHSDSYFLSSAECIYSAQMQEQFHVPCKYSTNGWFGSRFITAVITGNDEGNIDIQAYQVSNVAMAMVRDKIIEASTDPSLLRVKTKSKDQYIPDVFYKYKNNYGIMVQEAANPTFPVDYLLITLSHGFPSQPNPLFISSINFPIENRNGLETQNMEKVKKQLDPKTKDGYSDFHLLLYLSFSNVLDEESIKKLAKCCISHNEVELKSLMKMGNWKTLEMILNDSDMMDYDQSSSNKRSGDSAPWACKYCTFVNVSSANCEMCGLPHES